MSGIYNLGDRAITTALTNEVITSGVSSAGVAQSFIDRLSAATSVTFYTNFTYGSGGTTCIAIIQTSLDGVNWIDIARFDFATASAAKRANLSNISPIGVGAIATLSVEGQINGIFGDRLRTVITSTGTYAGNTAISVRAAVR